MPSKWEPTNPNDLIASYCSGASVNQLAKEHRVSRATIGRFLMDSDIELRSASEQERIKWSRIKSDRRLVERQCSAAWRASKGRPITVASRIQAAKTCYERMLRISPREIPFIDGLCEIGFTPKPQFSIGTYNVDIAIEPCRLAVEIQHGRSSTKLKRWQSFNPERIEYLFSAGWSMLLCYCPQNREFIVDRVLPKIVAFIHVLSSDETVRPAYGVIGRDGEPMSALGFNFDGRTRVEGF